MIAAARHGYKAHGYELNQWLIWYSRLQARLQGLHGKATFSKADLWKVKNEGVTPLSRLQNRQFEANARLDFQALCKGYTMLIRLSFALQVNLSGFDTVVIFGVAEMVNVHMNVYY